MMEPKSTIKQMVAFNKAVIGGSLKGFFRLQEEAEQMAIALCDNTPSVPEPAKKAMATCFAAHKNLHDNFIAMMDAGFNQAEKYLSTF